MAQNSSIEWTDTTWNPLAGCTRASAGCDNCYAAKMSLRLEAMALADIAAGKDPGGKRKYIGIATKNGRGVPAFNGTINLDRDELARPLFWKKPRRVFVNSMSDLFHKDVPDAFITDVFNVMHDNPMHTFQVLTKRPERAAEWSKKVWRDKLPDNVWIGTSVENQETADERIPELLRVRAAVRFLSCEPLLGPVDLTQVAANNDGAIDALDPGTWEEMWEAWRDTSDNWQEDFNEWFHVEDGSKWSGPVHPGIQWVIVGGESGPHARPMHPDWARSLRDQCQASGVPFFFKQHGEWLPFGMKSPEWDYEQSEYYQNLNVERHEFYEPSRRTMYKVGKKAAGRLLDGREWTEWPEQVQP